MTVDETMTYFSGFSLPGCPAALPFMPSSCLPVSIILPPSFPSPTLSFGTHAPPRVHSGSSFSVSPSLVHFLSLCHLLFFANPFRLTPSRARKGDLYVKRVNIFLRLQSNVRLNISFRTLNVTRWCNKVNSIAELIKIKVNYINAFFMYN